MSTSLASPMRSNCDIVSANVTSPRDNGDPGTILGVGLGVGKDDGAAMGVGVGIGSSSLSGVVDCAPPTNSTTLIISTVNSMQVSFLKFPPHIGGCLKI